MSGWKVERFARIGSTSDEARRRALAGDAGRVWIVADEQTSGRGRHGRSWSSPPGNLYASALIVDPCETVVATEIGFVAGVALRRALADAGAGRAALKWPNDIVVEGAKLAGLLVEGVTPPGRKLAAIVGFGVNVATSPQGLAYPTASLAGLGASISPLALLERLGARFEEALREWRRGAGFAEIRGEWLAHAAGIGGLIRIADARGQREGAFEGVDERGRLRLRVGAQIETIDSADVFLNSQPQSGAPQRSGRAESPTL